MAIKLTFLVFRTTWKMETFQTFTGMSTACIQLAYLWIKYWIQGHRGKNRSIFGLTDLFSNARLVAILPFRLRLEVIMDPKNDQKKFKINYFIQSVGPLRYICGESNRFSRTEAKPQIFVLVKPYLWSPGSSHYWSTPELMGIPQHLG